MLNNSLIKQGWFRALIAVAVLAMAGAGLLVWDILSEARHTGLNDDLSHALFRDDLLRIRQLLAEGADPDTPVLSSHRTESIVERLKRSLLRQRAPLGRGETALFRAAAHGDLEMVNSLLAHGANPNTMAIFGHTALHLAAGMADKRNTKSAPLDHRTMYSVCKALLEAGANPNIGNTMDGTPYNHAVCLRDEEITHLFLKHGAKWHAQSLFAGSAYLDAVQHNRVEMVRMMLQNGANPNQTENRHGASALMIAVENKNGEMTQSLLNAGAAPNAQDDGHQGTALLEAVCTCSADIVKLLLDHGARPDLRGPRDTRTPLYFARERDDKQILRMLEAAAKRQASKPSRG